MKDKRIQCPHCKVRTWSNDWRMFMRGHDRPDGRVCRAAQAMYVEATISGEARYDWRDKEEE
jgi:hypothetical protein